jgi:osmoprotectant transport system permease protein
MTPLVAADEPLIRWDWVRDHTDDIRAQLWEHLQLTGLAVGIGFVIALCLALVAVRWRKTYAPLAAFCAALYSVPSLALFALLLPFVGLGTTNALIALVTYTLLILLRNIVAGLDGVPPDVREAADGMGFEGWRRVLRVDLPLATPAIIAGLRIATVTTIGLVTVTALVGEGGFGRFINDGLSRQFPTPIVLGSVLSVALAIACDVLFVLLERVMTPWTRAGARPGRRRGGREARADEMLRDLTRAQADDRVAAPGRWIGPFGA